MNALARAILASCQRAGVGEFVVCAGARNAAVAAPLAMASEAMPNLVRVWNCSEERCAAFFALGRARASGAPVAVVTTSGTAVAELLPAVVEAHYQGVPLLALTADRPAAFRGTGAPQAIEQPGIFGGYVRGCLDVTDSDAGADCLGEWDLAGPMHLNVCLPEPVASDCEASAKELTEILGESSPPRRARPRPPGGSEALSDFLATGAPILVMLGEIPGAERPGVRDFLCRLQAPVLAEAISGLREDPGLKQLVMHGGERAASAILPARVLRIGGVPAWRLWRELEERPEIPVLSVTPTGLPGLARPSETVRNVDWGSVKAPTGAPPQIPEFFLGQLLGQLLDRFPKSECSLIAWLSRTIPENSTVFLGNSLPIREWNLAAEWANRGLSCFANRGANGIDGAVSTALGIGADTDELWILLGDLTALYDLAALWILPQLPCRRVRVVVVNNGGGRIFSRLPALRGAGETVMRLVENRHRLSFEGWAALWGMAYVRANEAVPLALPDGAAVIELVPDEAESAEFWNAWEQC